MKDNKNTENAAKGQNLPYQIFAALIACVFLYLAFTNIGFQKPFFGTHNIYHTGTRQLKETHEYKFGKRNGLARKYYISGSLESECYYIKDLLEAEFIKYYESGGIERISTYQDGIKTGLERFYDKSGKQTISQVSYNKGYVKDPAYFSRNTYPDLDGFVNPARRDYQAGSNWVRNGLNFTGFYESGKIMEQGQYVNKGISGIYKKLLADGPWKYYSTAGMIFEEKVYENGKLLKTVHYGADGKITGETPGN